jgi:hypothetical protein
MHSSLPEAPPAPVTIKWFEPGATARSGALIEKLTTPVVPKEGMGFSSAVIT